jgi:hypothetical protein
MSQIRNLSNCTGQKSAKFAKGRKSGNTHRPVAVTEALSEELSVPEEHHLADFLLGDHRSTVDSRYCAIVCSNYSLMCLGYEQHFSVYYVGIFAVVRAFLTPKDTKHCCIFLP